MMAAKKQSTKRTKFWPLLACFWSLSYDKQIYAYAVYHYVRSSVPFHIIMLGVCLFFAFTTKYSWKFSLISFLTMETVGWSVMILYWLGNKHFILGWYQKVYDLEKDLEALKKRIGVDDIQ